VLVASVGGLSCGGATVDPRAVPPQQTADKAALFGDPSLVPTRDGERIRSEIASAGEIELAIAALPSVVRSRVVVERAAPTAAVPGSRVLVVVHARPETETDPLRQRVVGIIAVVVEPTLEVEIIIERDTVGSPGPGVGFSWPLMLGVLGLGFFGGTLLERARRLRF